MSNYQRMDDGQPAMYQQQQYPVPYPPSAQQPYPQSSLPAPIPLDPSSYPPSYPPAQSYPASAALPRPGHLLHGAWSDGIFDCFDSGVICLLSLFLPCVRFAQTVSRLRFLPFPTALLLHGLPYVAYTVLYVAINVAYPQTYGTDTNPDYSAAYIALLVVMMAAHLAYVLVGTVYRGRLRREYGIEGNGCEDFCWHLCCNCCAIAQEARHVDRDFGVPV